MSITRLLTASLFALGLVVLSYVNLNSPALADEPKKKLIVGTEATFPPFESKDDKGNFVGFDIDLVKAIASKQGMEVEFKDLPFDSLIPALQAGQIDMIASGLSITDERKKSVDYSEPYFNGGLSIAVQKKNDKIKGSADLKGKTAAVQQGSTGAAKAEALQKEGVLRGVRQFPNVPLAMMELAKGGVDVVINDRPVSEALVAKMSNDVKLLDEVLDADSYGFAVKKGNEDLLKKINAGLAAAKEDGTIKGIMEKYFKAPAADDKPAESAK